RERPGLALYVKAHVKSRGTDSIDQRVQPSQARLGFGVGSGLCGSAQDPDQAAHVGCGFAAKGLDRLQRAPSSLGLLGGDSTCRAGVENDHADRVGDHVVEVSRNPSSLICNCAMRALVLLRQQTLSSLHQLALALAALAQVVTQYPCGSEEGVVVWDVAQGHAALVGPVGRKVDR